MKKFAIFIPAYNEEKLIVEHVTRAWHALKGLSIALNEDIDLVILNDGSVDNTKSKLDILLKLGMDITVINCEGPSRRENLIKHMSQYPVKFVGFMDCDLATDLRYLPFLLINACFYDVVTGCRYAPSSKIKRTKIRRLISFLFNSSLRLAFGSKIRDHECGFKMFKREKLQELLKYTGVGNKQRKMFWDSEMWMYAQKLNMKILEIPIEWSEGEKTALSFKKELPMLWYAFKFWVSGKWKN